MKRHTNKLQQQTSNSKKKLLRTSPITVMLTLETKQMPQYATKNTKNTNATPSTEQHAPHR